MAFPVIREKHRVSRGYTALHKAVDIAPLIRGKSEPIAAVGAGRISHVDLGGWRAGNNFAITLFGDNSIWWYTHLSTIGNIRVGQEFDDGDWLNESMTGNTGNSFGTHLHLVRFADGVLDRFTDPWPYIKNEANPGIVKPVSKPPVKQNAPSRSVVIGSRLLLNGWVAYTDWTLTRYLYKNGERAWIRGRYTVIGIKGGNYKVRGPGGDAWVSGKASAGLI